MLTRFARVIAAGCSVLLLTACAQPADESWLGAPEHVATGVEFYRNHDPALVEGVGPIAVHLLKIDLAATRLASVLSQDRVLDDEAVVDMAVRHNAIAAINGGFFNRDNGEPTGILKVAGELVSDSGSTKGVVVVSSPAGGPATLTFDRLAARMSITFGTDAERRTVQVDGVDTTRERGKLMLYTPGYHADTDTAPTGTEWVLDGEPLRVTEVRVGFGRTPIPPRGIVLSYGGLEPPASLAPLQNGTAVTLATHWRSQYGVPDDHLDRSYHIINGAGLLRRDGVPVTDWKVEGLSAQGFTDIRHPRTLIGRDVRGAAWLVAIDGRQPDYSIGMRFADMQRLADRLELTDALNLDGGGSTTMVVRGHVVNRPSDPAGARPVADAIIVTAR